MKISYAIDQLDKNKTIIYTLLQGASKIEYTWKQSSDKWNLLEIICHLYDEEVEDFRTRTKNVLKTPNQRPPSFNPEDWVNDRKYAEQNFYEKLLHFLLERDKSIQYLKSLKTPLPTHGYNYKAYGHVDGLFFLTNWLAHDYLHIKQIVRLKYDYAAYCGQRDINYAGTWK